MNKKRQRRETQMKRADSESEADDDEFFRKGQDEGDTAQTGYNQVGNTNKFLSPDETPGGDSSDLDEMYRPEEQNA